MTNVLDLTDEVTLEHLGVDAHTLVEDDRTQTHLIGEVAHQFGYQAVLNASATGVDQVIAVLVENIRGGIVDPALDQNWNSIDDLPVF